MADEDHVNPLEETFYKVVLAALDEKIKTGDLRTNRLLDPIKAAEYLGIGRSKIYDMISNAELPIVKVGRLTMLDIEDLEAWIKANKTNAKVA